jgi:phosphate transport system substrate-binding protein
MHISKRLISTAFTLLMVLALVAACGSSSENNAADSTTITMSGSTTVQPVAEKLAEAYMTDHSNVRVDVQGGGSSVGVKAAGQKTTDIGMASRDVKDSEFTEFPGINVFAVARDGIAIVANPDVNVDDLTIDQIKGIFGGTITNWKELGGDDASIIVASREEGSGTRAAFEEWCLVKRF